MHEAGNGNTPAAVAARELLQKMAELPDLKNVSYNQALTLALKAECNRLLRPAVSPHLSFAHLRLDVSNDWTRPYALSKLQTKLKEIAQY